MNKKHWRLLKLCNFFLFAITILFHSNMLWANKINSGDECEQKQLRLSALNISVSINELLTLKQMLIDSKNKKAIDFLNSLIDGNKEIAETLLVQLTESSDVNNGNLNFENSEIGGVFSSIFKNKIAPSEEKKPSYVLPPNMKNKLGHEGEALFESLYRINLSQGR